ncbi:hypothetical protein C5L22_22185 [Pantoea ananatis]|nr:hypothetical protein C5L22_22185 [Pantoea ananatis]
MKAAQIIIRYISFTVLPSSVTYRTPPETPWPKTHGPQTAKVVGPKGESTRLSAPPPSPSAGRAFSATASQAACGTSPTTAAP